MGVVFTKLKKPTAGHFWLLENSKLDGVKNITSPFSIQSSILPKNIEVPFEKCLQNSVKLLQKLINDFLNQTTEYLENIKTE